MPLTHHELYKQIGIDPPRGVLLYGPPGTGKTMLAKAVAHHTTAAFIRVVGSEFVQKYLGEVCLKSYLNVCIASSAVSSSGFGHMFKVFNQLCFLDEKKKSSCYFPLVILLDFLQCG